MDTLYCRTALCLEVLRHGSVYIVQSMDVSWIHCIVKLPYIWTVLYRCVHCTIHGCVMDTLYCQTALHLDSAI